MMIREMRGGTAYATCLTGPRGPEYRRDDTNGAVKWYVYDGLGSVVGEIDPTGNMTATRSHDVYGLVRSSTGQRTSSHGFVGSLGHTSEDNTGLIYMRARYMDPVLGRFASEDPAEDGANWYVYCTNNPPNYYDPFGSTKEIAIPGMRNWTYRVDRPYNSAAKGGALDQDVTILFKGEQVGSFGKNGGAWKHGPTERIPNGVSKGLKSRGFTMPCAGDSVSAYMEANPLDCISILLDCAGDDEDAAKLDRINGSF